MKKLPHLFALLFLLCQNSVAQMNVPKDIRIAPLLKQAASGVAGFVISGRKDAGTYVNMAVLDNDQKKLTWFTCYGSAFDSAQLTDIEFNYITAKTINPFDFYKQFCLENIAYLEDAASQFRQLGKDALKDTTYHRRVVYNTPSVKSAPSTLQKVLTMENLLKKQCLQLAMFNSKSPLSTPRSDSFLLRKSLVGKMVRRGDTTTYYNTYLLGSAAKIVLYERFPEKMFVCNWQEQVIDSVPLKPGKYASLLKEKEDVFVLYRGWLELQSQQILYARRQIGGLLNRQDTGLYTYANLPEGKQQLWHSLLQLAAQQQAIEVKIGDLLLPDQQAVKGMLQNAYPDASSEVSYLDGSGFAYTIAYTRGQKVYELTDHRGNVMATVSDKKKGIDENQDGVIEYYNADVVSASDYYPFGSLMPGRTYRSGDKYRYGYNGKENDDEVKGEGNQQDYGMRVYDPRLGRFLSVDPLISKYSELTPYQFASNRPIDGIDLDGLEFTPGTFDYKNALYIGNLTLPDDEKLEQKQIEVWGNAMNEGQRKGRLAGGALAVDIYTKGKLSFYTGIFGAFWHNVSTTSEGRAAQAEESKEALLAAGISWGSGKLLSNILKAMPRKTPLLPIRAITVVEEDGYAVVRDAEGVVAGRGWLTQGELNLTIKTKGTTLNGRGGEVLEEIYKYINTNFDEIKTIRGNWKAGDLGDNLKTFNELVHKLGPEKAAMKTFTGKMVEKLKFEHADVTLGSQDANGDYKSVDVIFKKE